jgi:polysaccharide biosynthesis/export protein
MISITRFLGYTLVFLCSLSSIFAEELALKPGERITISVGGVPDNEIMQLSKTYTISDGGSISLLHIGDIAAAGVKPSRLQKIIEQTYISREIYTSPNVVISIDGGDAATLRNVFVTGGVNRPGAVPFKQGTTLSIAISNAGGKSPFGSLKKVKLVRGATITIHNLQSGTGDPSVDVEVQPDDQIVVPE